MFSDTETLQQNDVVTTIPPNSSTTDAISPENEDIMFSWLKEKIL